MSLAGTFRKCCLFSRCPTDWVPEAFCFRAHPQLCPFRRFIFLGPFVLPRGLCSVFHSKRLGPLSLFFHCFFTFLKKQGDNCTVRECPCPSEIPSCDTRGEITRMQRAAGKPRSWGSRGKGAWCLRFTEDSGKKIHL